MNFRVVVMVVGGVVVVGDGGVVGQGGGYMW